MNGHKMLNRHLEKSGKLGVSPSKRRELVARGLLSQGGTVSPDAVDNAKPPRDRAAFVRALLGK